MTLDAFPFKKCLIFPIALCSIHPPKEKQKKERYNPPETNISLKSDGWKIKFHVKMVSFQGKC